MNKHAYNHHCSMPSLQLYLWAKRSLIYLRGRGRPGPSPAQKGGTKPALALAVSASPGIPCHYIILITQNYLILLRVPECISPLVAGGKPTKTMQCVMSSLPFLWYIRSFWNQLTSKCGGVSEACVSLRKRSSRSAGTALCQRKYMQKVVPKISPVVRVGKQN